MNAHTPVRTPQINRWSECDDAVEAAERKAARIALYEKREAQREAASRAPVGWLTRYNDGADEAVRGLIDDGELARLSKGQRRFGRSGL